VDHDDKPKKSNHVEYAPTAMGLSAVAPGLSGTKWRRTKARGLRLKVPWPSVIGRRYTPYRALGQPIRGHGQNNMKGTKILEQKILFYAQLIIVILTFIQSWQNRQTLKEMKTSRTESVSPLLLPELGAKIKGVFDGDTSYKFDLKVDVDPSLKAEKKIELTPFDITLTNIGKGPACNLIVREVNKCPVLQSEKSIRIIKPEEFKQIQFSIHLEKEDFIKEFNTMKITYEDIYGEKYEQDLDFEVDRAFYQVKRIHFNRPKH